MQLKQKLVLSALALIAIGWFLYTNDELQQRFSFESPDEQGLKTNYNLLINRLYTNIKSEQSNLHHSSYNRLAYLVDTIGPRLWGGPQQELFIEALKEMIEDEGINVTLEPVGPFERWERGEEILTLYEPRPVPTNLKIIGLGNSVPGNITAEVLVVTSFEELEKRKDEVKGKIVCYVNEWTNYMDSFEIRTSGAAIACNQSIDIKLQFLAQYGAMAVLIKSVTPYSIESPHTGIQFYNETMGPKIPAAAMTVEDAHMFKRMQERGQKIMVNLYMESKLVPDSKSYNLLAEIKGSEKPDEIVLFGGHTDSWDTGSQTGANDDGGGIITCVEALIAIKRLGYQPRRTMRVIGWSGEEFGDDKEGAQQYRIDHQGELDKHIVVFESDLGSTKPYGFGFSGESNAQKYIQQILDVYLEPLNCTKMTLRDGVMPDTFPLFEQGVPAMRNLNWDLDPEYSYQFTYQHSAGDSMTIMNPDDMDDNVIAIAAMMFILADMANPLPRD